MNRFTVVWSPNEVERLTEIWMQSSDRGAVAIAADQIDRRLRDDPTRYAEPVHEGLWGLNQPPLRVLFSVSEDDRRVEVVLVETAE
jgi:hypothetical protein